MNLKEILTEIRSGKEAKLIAQAAIQQPKYLHQLWQLSISNWDKAWRAAWVIDHMYQQDNDSVKNIVEYLPQAILSIKNQSVLRHFVKLISLFPLKQYVSGEFINRCLEIFESTTTPVALRVHAMQVLFNFAMIYPDFKNELILLIEHHTKEGSKGLQSRAKKLLTELNKTVS